jgi:agmatinase
MPLVRTDATEFTGIPTFIRAPSVDIEHVRPGMFAVAGVPYDLSARVPGARYGPRAIRTASSGLLNAADVLNDRWTDAESAGLLEFRGGPDFAIGDLGDFAVTALDWDTTSREVERAMYETVSAGAIPLILGGDHFITLPLITGFQRARAENGHGRVGYLRFSSRLDLGVRDEFLGDTWRGATARRILESDIVSGPNMVWLGVSGYVAQAELELVRARGLRVHTLREVRSDGISAVTDRALSEAGAGCDTVYVSIDMDVVDGAYLPCQGVRSFRGLHNVELQEAMNVLSSGAVGALDVVGTNPLPDFWGHGQVVSYFAASMIFYFMMRPRDYSRGSFSEAFHSRSKEQGDGKSL